MSFGKPFESGKSGNPTGRPKMTRQQRLGKLMDGVLKQKLKEKDGYLAEALATRLIQLARKGSLKAIEMILERTEGKPQQSLNLKTDEALTVKDIDQRITELFRRAAARETESGREDTAPGTPGSTGPNSHLQ